MLMLILYWTDRTDDGGWHIVRIYEDEDEKLAQRDHDLMQCQSIPDREYYVDEIKVTEE